jgi:hypothetical protein
VTVWKNGDINLGRLQRRLFPKLALLHKPTGNIDKNSMLEYFDRIQGQMFKEEEEKKRKEKKRRKV